MNINNTRRWLPVGLQSFEKIREQHYLYVDKTDLVWQLANSVNQYVYLSRPRRFGKSLLVDTLKCYFEGRRELFEGLRVAELETEWTVHPVIRLDMSVGGQNERTLRDYLDQRFEDYESFYGITPKATASLASRFHRIIETAYRQTGRQVVILIDEYDAPLQHSWGTPEHEACTAVYRDVFAILKSDDVMLRFVFITGITKFTQISLFSVLNNLTNISFEPEYAAICGITQDELYDNFQPEIAQLAARYGWTTDEAMHRLKDYYDGYHFSDLNMADIYNPFSLINALSQLRLRSYWASSGATSMLPKFVKGIELRLENFDNCSVLRDELETSDVTGGPELFLYQCGYLTIKAFGNFNYTLGIPNEEVRQALNRMVLPALTLRQQDDTKSMQANLAGQLETGQADAAMRTLRSLIADVPYSNKKMASMDMEERYRLIISTVLQAVGIRVEVERMLATGRIDIVAWVPRYIYVLELKLSGNGGLEAACRQMKERAYAEPFRADGREVVGLAVELDSEGKGLTGWLRIEDEA